MQTCNINLYIPVWIDLKGVMSVEMQNAFEVLHSSMDRFKADYIEKNRNYRFVLHSSMDRFKA